MDQPTAEALLHELKALNANLAAFKSSMMTAAGLVAAAQLIATDASRSEVFATQLDDQVVEVGARLVKMATPSA
jgi:hypothetical protein